MKKKINWRNWRKYFWILFSHVGKETWQILPFRAKLGLILIDVIQISVIIGIIVIAILRLIVFRVPITIEWTL